jgi:alkylation response protein AidB-like acyl-CoA dehydrogenase
VHFAFTDQQDEFREAVRQVLGKECAPEHVRAAFEDPSPKSLRWTTLAELGVVGLTVPDGLGGLGLGLVDLVPLIEEAGWAALPEPLVATTALAAPLFVGLGTREAETWLESIASGATTAAVATPSSPGGPVAGAVGADLFVLTSGQGGAERALHVVASSDVTVTPVPSLDPTRRLGTLEWSPTSTSVVATGPEAETLIAAIEDRAAIATAAELLGLSARMITVAADYAKERQQFGKPIGSFQAVKHLLAGAQVKLEFARPMVYGAAWSLEESEPTASRSASAAKAYASDAATEAARASLQVHGAIGYTWECDLQLFLKRAWALAEAWGSADDHRARVLASLLATD